MAKNEWGDALATVESPRDWGDRPAAQQDLPAGVQPSLAGAGRGFVVPPAGSDRGSTFQPDSLDAEFGDVATGLRDAPAERPVSVLQTEGMNAPPPSRRLGLGAGPISQQTAADAEALVDGRATRERAADPVVQRAAAGIKQQVDAGQRDTFGAQLDRTQQRPTQELATQRTADEWRSVGEWANDTGAALVSGAVSLAQLPVNIIAPGSALSESLQKSQQNLQDFESEPMKARRQELADRVNGEEGFLDQYAATVAELVSNPSVAIHETMRQAAMFAGVLTAARGGAAAAQGGVALAGRVSPTVALGEAISGGSIAARAGAAGATAGGVAATTTMAAGDAAGNAYEKLMSAPQSMWEQSEDYQNLIAKGVDPQAAKQEIATAKARTAAMIAAPLGLLGFMGAEASFVSRGAGSAAGQPLRVAATELITEPAEEALTQVAGNYAAQTVNPEQSLGEGAGEAAGMATVTSGPFAAAGAVNEMRKPIDRTEQIKALRAAGDTTAADMLKRRFDREMATYNAGSESQRLADFGQAAQDVYRQIRMSGAQPGDAVVKTAIRTGFEQAAQMAGLSPKAKAALDAKLETVPPEKAPAVVQKYITALAQAGAAQQFEGLDTLAGDMESQMDRMLDAVIAGSIEPTTEGETNDTEQTTATEAQADTAGAGASTVADDAAPGQQEALDALSEVNDVIVTPELDAVHQAATSPLNDLPDPSQAQKEAGNYTLGRLKIAGLKISVENPQGSVRRGTDEDGKAWESPMRDHYGYIRGTTAADGDKLDLFIKPGTPETFDGTVFVVDQIDPKTGKFDEAKVVMGAADEAEAEAIYRRNYSADWQGLGAITALPMTEFKAWAASDATKKPLGKISSEQTNVQDAPQGTAGETQAQAVEAPAAEGGDGATSPGVSAEGGAGQAQADGVTGPLGRDSVPIAEGGKPFRTKNEADKARKLQPTMRVVKSGKGFALASKTPAQIAAQEKAAKRLGSVGNAGVPMAAHELLASRGGLSKEAMADLGFDRNQRVGAKWLFSAAGGMSLERATEALQQAGYMQGTDQGEAIAMIQRSARGNPVYTPDGYEQMAQAESEARFEDYLAAQDDPFGSLMDDGYEESDMAGTGFEQASPEVQAEVAALSAQMEAIGRDPVDIMERLALQYPDDTQKEFHERAKAALTQAVAEATQPAGRGDSVQDGSESGPAPTEGEGQGLTLEDRPDGTLAVRGDSKALRERLTAAGIPARSILPSATGVVVGKTQAKAAREALQPVLTNPTRSEVEAQQDRTEQADKLDQREQIKRESEVGDNSFMTGFDGDGRQDTTNDLFSAPAEPNAVQAPAAAPEPVTDFGEKLPPARRAMATKLSEELTDEAIASQPLSKIWPLEENDAIEDTFVGAVAHVMREAIPAKPRSTYKVKGWVEKVKMLRDFTATLLRGAITKDRLMSGLQEKYALRDLGSKIKLLEQIDRAQWKRIGDVSERPDAIRYVDGKPVPTPMASVNIDGKSHWLKDSGNLNDHLDAIKALLAGAAPESRMQFEIRQERSGAKRVFINKKGDKSYRSLMDFATVAEARAAIKDKYDDLVMAWDGVKNRDNITERDLRTDVNRDRTGKDHRKGRDVSAEEFQTTFGFRGGEFGKWVSQGKGAQERQFMLNSSYDALMDLSDILGIPPRAISLEGTLGIAFGSRGGGWASAHFEPSNLVINLTKPRGAGALAHEWFHALDNYFARKRGGEVEFKGDNNAYRRDNFITHKTRPMMVRKDGRGSPITRERLAEWRKQSPDSAYLAEDQWIQDPNHKDGVRAEVEERFDELVKVLDASPMLKRSRLLEGSKEGDGYWSRTLERAARAFENYVQASMMEQGYHNDFLANVKAAPEVGKNVARYPYLLPSEVAPVADAFSNLFSTIQTRETDDGNVALFSRPLTADLFRQMTTPMARGMKADEVRTAVAAVVKGWNNGPAVNVVADVSALPMEAPADIHGVYHQGQVYLVASNIGSPTQAQLVLAHEAIAHHGLRDMQGAEAHRQFMSQIQLALKMGNKPLNAIRDEVRAAYVDEDGKFSLSPEQEADEIAARVVEQAVDAEGKFRPGFGFVKAVYARIAEFLRSIGFNVTLTMTELQGALVNAQRNLEAGKRTHGARSSLSPVWARSKAPSVPRAIIGSNLGAATSHPKYAAAKAGDIESAVEVARALVTDEIVGQVRTLIGNRKPVVVPVVSVEASGRNKIPLASAELLAQRLGLQTDTGIVQANSPKRTSMDGLDRIFASPEFDGQVVRGQDYVILDDTLTQGATFAALAAHIESAGGRVVAAVALTGKQYSARIQPSTDTLKALRDKHGDLEAEFQAATGYGFDALTESEARYLANFKPAQSLRDRIIEEGRRAGQRQDQGPAGDLSGPAFSRSVGVANPATKAPAPTPATAAAPATPAQLPLPASQGTPPSRAPVPQESRARAAQRVIQDQFNRFTVIRNWAKEQGMNLSQISDVWGFEERMHGRIATRVEDFREKRVQPLIERIQKAGFTMPQVAEYLHAQHAEERNKQILSIDPTNPSGSGMDTADAKVILAAAKPELVTLANEFRKIADDTKTILLNGGIISQEMVDAWDKTYQHYVPLKGGDQDTQPVGTGKGLSVKATNKRALGHGERSEFIIENMLRDHERAVMLVEKNRVGHSLLAMTIELGRDDIATFGQPERRKVLKNTTSFEVVGKNGAVVGTFDSQQAANAFIVTQKRAGLTVRQVKGDPVVSYMASPMLAENEVQVYVKGQTVRIQLNDPLLARGYKKLGVEHLGRVMQVNREINGFLSKAYTGYNPEFFIKNVLRDFTSGLINITGQEGALIAAKAAARYPKAFGQMLRYSFSGGKKASPSIQAYRDQGGTTGAAYLSDIERVGADIQAAYERYQGALQLAASGKPLKAANVAGAKLVRLLIGFMEHLNAAGENAMRLAVFDAVRNEPGRTIQEAASLAKNSTVNFNRKGEMGAQANALYLFFNAAMQGTAATLDALLMAKHRHQAQAVAGALGALAYSLAALQFGGDDDEDREAWEKIPDHVKDRNLVIRTSEDTYITLAVPYGYGFFFTLGNAAFDLQRGADKDKIGLKLASGLVEHFGPAINPISGDDLDPKGFVEFVPGLVGGEIMRAGARLIVNRSGLGGEIVPDSPFDEGKPDNLRAYRSSKGTGYEAAANMMNQITGGTKSQPGMIDVSPETLKFWTQTITGGAGKFVMDTTNTATLMGAMLSENDPEAVNALTPEIRELPLVRTVVRKQDIRDTRRVYWEKVKEAEEAQRAFNRAKKMGDADAMVSLATQEGHLLALAKHIKKTNEAVKALRDSVELINLSEDYTRAEKRMMTKDLERGEEALYDGMISVFEAVGKN